MTTRRQVLAAGLLLVPAVASGKPRERPAKDKGEAEVTPLEDLMREHGVLRRVLLVYDEAGRRLAERRDLPGGVVPRAAGIVRRFIEDYHEKNEEQHVFPRLERAGKQVELVKVLRAQHQAGRAVTGEIEKASGIRLADLMARFTRMYRAHAAREDTVLFPEFRDLLGDRDYRELGERLEESEHRMFGEGGFEKALAEVADLERAMGIADLAQLTP